MTEQPDHAPSSDTVPSPQNEAAPSGPETPRRSQPEQPDRHQPAPGYPQQPPTQGYGPQPYAQQPPAQPYGSPVYGQQPVYVQQPAYAQSPMVSMAQVGPDKSVGVAYLLLIFLGVFGAHQFYLDKIGRGVGYLFTLGWLTAGLWIDLFTLPSQVRAINTQRRMGIR